MLAQRAHPLPFHSDAISPPMADAVPALSVLAQPFEPSRTDLFGAQLLRGMVRHRPMGRRQQDDRRQGGAQQREQSDASALLFGKLTGQP